MLGAQRLLLDQLRLLRALRAVLQARAVAEQQDLLTDVKAGKIGATESAVDDGNRKRYTFTNAVSKKLATDRS